MANPFEDMAATFVGEAALHPERAQQVYQRAAQTFAGLAADPRNVRLAQRLSAMAADFARGARRPAAISDMLDLLREKAEAYQEVGTIYDDMGPEARYREIHEDRSPGLPRVSIAPKSVKAGTRLGDQATLKWHLEADDELAGIKRQNTVIQWQGEHEEAQAVTVSVGLVGEPPPESVEGSFRFYGIVTFGSDGTRASVKFDVGRGTRFTVVGSYVDVLLAAGEPPIDLQKTQVTLGASIGFFAAPSIAPVIFTEYIDNLPDTETSGFLPRPAGAMQLLPMQSSVAAGTATITFYGINQTIPLYVVSWTNSALNTPIPLANDVAFIEVTNTSGGPSNFRLPFQLAL